MVETCQSLPPVLWALVTSMPSAVQVMPASSMPEPRRGNWAIWVVSRVAGASWQPYMA
jgi:hypothetical protein